MSDSTRAGGTAAGDAAAALWSTWVEAQQQAMRGWADMAGAGAWTGTVAAPASPGAERGAVPGLDAFIGTWQNLSQQAMRSFMAGADPTARGAAEQMRAAQEAGFRLFGQLAEAWQGMARQVERGASWSDAAAAFSRMQRQSMAGFAQAPGDWSRLGIDSAELWRQYLATLEPSIGAWAGLMRRDGAPPAGESPRPGSEIWELGRRYWDAWGQISKQLSASPRVGFNREAEERLIHGFETWVASMQAQQAYQQVLAEAYAEAYEAALAALARRAEAGEPVGSLAALSELWIRESDQVMERALAGERYAKAQGEMVAANMRHRQSERAIADALLADSFLASKSELDEAYRAIAELRRDLRSLRQELNTIKGGKA